MTSLASFLLDKDPFNLARPFRDPATRLRLLGLSTDGHRLLLNSVVLSLRLCLIASEIPHQIRESILRGDELVECALLRDAPVYQAVDVIDLRQEV